MLLLEATRRTSQTGLQQQLASAEFHSGSNFAKKKNDDLSLNTSRKTPGSAKMSGKPTAASVQKELEELKANVSKNFLATNSRVEDVERRVTRTEERQNKLEKKIQYLEDDLNDLQRQSHKICVVLGGPDLPPRSHDENPLAEFTNAVLK